MRRACRRPSAARRARLESIEPRLVMSGSAASDFVAEYFVEDYHCQQMEAALAEAHELTGLAEAFSEYGFTGLGQTVAVIDTGIAYDHAALGGGFGTGYRVVGGWDFTGPGDADPYDDGPYGSHGTHVAGIIASDDGSHRGVAPGVDLVALRVFNDAGQGSFDWVEEALRWVHANRDAFANPITTVNLSIGSAWNSDAPPAWAELEDELAQLEADGLLVAVAAGNRFTTFEEPGLSYPAASPYVVPVSAVDDNGQMSYFSQRHDRAIAAPGRSVMSTVPDYVGNGNGIDDDFARYSGTSMAAPYVAGASVLLRQAYEFVGQPDVSQGTIYDLMRSTADLVYDAATGQNYHRLNVRRALDRIMPEDDVGSYAYAAEDLGTVVDTQSFSGTIAELDDRDFFRFTAAQTGQVTLSADVTHEMRPRWELADGADAAPGADGSLSFRVSAGQTYTVGLGTEAGLGHYTVHVSLDADLLPPDDRGIRQAEFLDNEVSAAGHWFSFAAAQDGILTVEAMFSNWRGDVDLEVLNADERLLAGSYSTADYERIDVAASAGETFYLYAYVSGTEVNDDVDFRITNLVSQAGDAVNVSGTEGDDRFSFAAGRVHRVTINGVSYEFDAEAVRSVSFDGLAGLDTADLSGGSGDEVAVLRVGSVDLEGPGYAVGASRVETVTVEGGGGSDAAFLYDSPGDDTFVAGPQEAELVGPGFLSRVVGFEIAHAYAKAGGFDVAKLYDSAGDDTFVATPTYGVLSGEGFFRRAKFFDAVYAHAKAGGFDVARLYDSAGDDTFVATPAYGQLSGEGFLLRAESFEAAHGYAKAGGYDVAALYDSGGDDTLVSTPVYQSLSGSGFFNRAKFFEEVTARASGGGSDTAYLYDSAVDDHFKAAADLARISNATLITWAYGFDHVLAHGTEGGSNTAEIAAVDYVLGLLGEWA